MNIFSAVGGLFGGGQDAPAAAATKVRKKKAAPDAEPEEDPLDDREGVSKAGTYQVIVKIIEAKGLYAIQRFAIQQLRMNVVSQDRVPTTFIRAKLVRSDGSPSVIQRTPARKNTSTPLFETLFYFDNLHVAEGELASCAVQIAAFDRGRFGPHMLIGSIDLDLEGIYQLPNHELWKTWLTLTDPKGKRDGPQGQVLACITVLGKEDQPADHTQDLETEPQEFEGNAFGDLDLGIFGIPKAQDPGALQREEFGIRLQAFMARDIPRMDWNSPQAMAGVQPYVAVTCGSKTVKTKRKASRDPQWRQEVGFQLMLPPEARGAPPVRFQLYDHNFTSSDNPIAAFRVPFREILDNKRFYNTPRWYPLYGAPREPEEEFRIRSGSKLARRMNCAFVEGNTYRGMLYMSVSADLSKNLPPVRRRTIAMTDPKAPANYVLLTEILYLDMTLPEDRGLGSETMVEMSYMLTSTKTAAWYEAKGLKDSGGDVFVFLGEKLKATNVLIPHPLDGEDAGTGAPDIFINVFWSSARTNKRRIAYGRVPMRDLLPAVETEFPEEGPEGAAGGKFAFQGWLTLTADPLSERKGSTTVRWARPQGKVLVRLQLTKKPGNKPYIVGVTDVEEAERKAEEEKRLLKAQGLLEDSEDEEEGGGKGKKKKGPKKKGKDDKPGFFEPGGTFGAAPDPEVVQAFSMRPYKLRVFLYQAVGIPATDSTGSSDPFCVVRCGKSVTRTQVCAATSSPAWFCEVVLDVQLPVCSRPDMMSFGAMVHNAKFVDRARRSMAMALYKPPPYIMKKNEDLPAISSTDPTSGGRLMYRGRRAGYAKLVADEEPDVRQPRKPPPTNVNAEVQDQLEDVDEEVAGEDRSRPNPLPAQDGDILWWACPNIFLTVYDKSSMSEEALSVAMIPLSVLNSKRALGGKDASGQLLKKYPLKYPMRAFEFHDARKNLDPEGGGGSILAAFSLEGPTDTVHAKINREQTEKIEAAKVPVAPGNYDGGVLGGGRKAAAAGPNVFQLDLPCQAAEVELMFLGVRNMIPMLGLPIVAPAVEADLTGVLPILRSQRLVAQTKHSGTPSGSNANYKGEMLHIRAKFPTDDRVEPGLNLRVRDKRLGAAPVVGVATLTPLPGAKGGGPTKEELEAENDAWAFMGKKMGSEGTISSASIADGLSELTGTDDGNKPAKKVEVKADDDDEEEIDPVALLAAANAAAGGDEASDPHGMGATPAYLVGREILPGPLEDALGRPPFITAPVYRIGFGKEEKEVVGEVKFCLRKVPLAPAAIPGKIEAFEAEQQGLYNRMDHLCSDVPFDDLVAKISAPERLTVRVYVLRGIALKPSNSKGTANPYVVCQLGNKTMGESKDVIKGTLYPPFYKMFEFRQPFPGACTLRVKVYEQAQNIIAAADGDELIGETEVDLEDRWFSDLWQRKYKELPAVEKRELKLTRDGTRQGQVEMFVEVLSASDAAKIPAKNIAPPPPELVELRVVIWTAEQMENKKKLLAQNDLFFKVIVQGTDRLGKVFLEEKSTDIHWFASGGKGNFNYRLVWRFELPLTNPRLKISAWHKDLVGTVDDTIGEYTESLSKKCGEIMSRLASERARGNKNDDIEILEPFPDPVNEGKKWIELFHPSAKKTRKGRVQIQYALLPVKKADKRPVGEAQDEPNRDPVLPLPDRAKLNLFDPMGSLMTIIGPERLKQALAIIIATLVFLIVGGMGFVILNDYISAEIMKAVGGNRGR